MEARAPEEHNTGGHEQPRWRRCLSLFVPRRDGTCLQVPPRLYLWMPCGPRAWCAHWGWAGLGWGWLAGWVPGSPGTHCLQHCVVDKDHTSRLPKVRS